MELKATQPKQNQPKTEFYLSMRLVQLKTEGFTWDVIQNCLKYLLFLSVFVQIAFHLKSVYFSPLFDFRTRKWKLFHRHMDFYHFTIGKTS